MPDQRIKPNLAFGKPTEGFSAIVADAITDILEERWREYIADKAASDESPNLLDFFSWLFFTEGWRARGVHEDLDQAAADHEQVEN